MKRRTLKAVIASAVVVLQGLPAFAQFEGATEKVLGLYGHMADLLKYVLGIGALCTLIGIIINVMKGEREAAEKLLYWTLGLAIGFILIEILEENIPHWINFVG